MIIWPVLATRHWFQPFFTLAKNLKLGKEVILEVFSRQKRGGKKKGKTATFIYLVLMCSKRYRRMIKDFYLISQEWSSLFLPLPIFDSHFGYRQKFSNKTLIGSRWTTIKIWRNVVTVRRGLQALIVEFAGEFASTVGLDWKMWLVSIFLGLFRFAYYPTYYF